MIIGKHNLSCWYLVIYYVCQHLLHPLCTDLWSYVFYLYQLAVVSMRHNGVELSLMKSNILGIETQLDVDDGYYTVRKTSDSVLNIIKLASLRNCQG